MQIHEQNVHRTWWQRNLKWKGLGGCLAVGFLATAFSVLLVVFLFKAMKTSGAYTGAMAIAQESSALADELGTPIEAGWFLTGSINVNGPSGDAQLSIPIAGPEGSGTLYLIAQKRVGEWEFELLEVEIEGRVERLDLLADK